MRTSSSGGADRAGDFLPAALVAAFGVAVVLVRPPLPLDETRYLEILRESFGQNPLLLSLCGEPYAEKPPLLFWLARLLAAGGVPWMLALRAIPALASALTVLCAAGVGRRAGLALAGWVQAALLLPFLTSELVLFDPLLACAVWAAVLAWSRGRDGASALACAAAFLAKGPVALLFLVPLLWCTSVLRPVQTRALARAALVLGCGVLALALWAIPAAIVGGHEFARALLWDRWAGRVVHSFAHERPIWFYAPIVLVGALPGTLLLFRRDRAASPVIRRTWLALAAILLAFTLVGGKQAHYLVPAAPALALILAWRIETTESGLRWLRRGVQLELALLLVLLAVAILAGKLPGAQRSAVLAVPGVLALGVALAAVLVRSRAPTAKRLLACAILGAGFAAADVHWIAGKFLYPHALADALAAEVPVAYVGSTKHGLYNLLAGQTRVEKLVDGADVARWIAQHPGGLIVVDEARMPRDLPSDLERVASDRAHEIPVVVLRAPVRREVALGR